MKRVGASIPMLSVRPASAETRRSTCIGPTRTKTGRPISWRPENSSFSRDTSYSSRFEHNMFEIGGGAKGVLLPCTVRIITEFSCVHNIIYAIFMCSVDASAKYKCIGPCMFNYTYVYEFIPCILTHMNVSWLSPGYLLTLGPPLFGIIQFSHRNTMTLVFVHFRLWLAVRQTDVMTVIQ